jgi:hypothetical protein
MSGPSLKKKHSHALIHEAALNEAEELLAILRSFLKHDEKEKALKAAYILVEHWETRTLRHAQAEEEGLYRDIAANHPDLKDTIIALTRDHELMRVITREIKEKLTTGEVADEVISRFESLMIIDRIHNAAEEKMLSD